ncbi:hypothetical protein VPH35_126116 [Triticum aestivum]
MDMDFGDARKESIEGSDAMLPKVEENSQHQNVEEVISHNKPKKNANLHIVPQGIFYYYYESYFCDIVFCIELILLIVIVKLAHIFMYSTDYVCTPRDITVIESIKSAPKNTQFVDIGDALLSTDELECLMKDDMFLHDGVINAYIYCILAHDHLQDRAGEKVHIVSTFVSGQIKEDRERDIDPSKYHRIVHHVNTYLQQDMLFIPINMPGYHWYLAVANAQKYQFTQEDMKHFRQKIAVILLDSELNKLKGVPIYHQPDDEETLYNSDDEGNLANSDLEILENPSDVVKDKRPTPITNIPTEKRELLAGLCSYIMSIDDARCLEKLWVRSSTPDPVGLSLKKLQCILNMEQPMDNECFNTAVRMLACDEGVLFTYPPVNYMDLRFCSMLLESTRGQKFCEKDNIQTLATLFDSWPGMDNDISSCNKLPGWNYDISKWQRLFPFGVPTSIDGNVSGYFVFHFMLWWNSKELVKPICSDGCELRKQFLLYLLKHRGNEAKESFPDIVKEFLKRII